MPAREANIGHFDMCAEAVRDVLVRAVERSRGERSSSTDTLPEAIPETIREETVDDEPVDELSPETIREETVDDEPFNEWTSQSGCIWLYVTCSVLRFTVSSLLRIGFNMTLICTCLSLMLYL